MHFSRSHGRLIGIIGLVAIPVLFSWGGISWFCRSFQSDLKSSVSKVEEERRSTLLSQAHVLTGSILHEIELFRYQVNQLAWVKRLQPSAAPPPPAGKVLHWAEFSTFENGLQLKQSGRSPLLNMNAAQENAYLNWIQRNVNPQKIASHDLNLFRLKKDAHTSGEWMVFAYMDSSKNNNLILFLVDPAQAFDAFVPWAGHPAGARSYLLGGDGRILAHTQKELISANFSGNSQFQNSIQKVLLGSQMSAAGDSRGVDRKEVRYASLRLGDLPIAVVVEEVHSAFPDFEGTFWILPLCFGLVLGCSYLINRYLVKTVTLTVRVDVEQNSRVFTPIPVSQGQDRFFMGDEFLILDPKIGRSKDIAIGRSKDMKTPNLLSDKEKT